MININLEGVLIMKWEDVATGVVMVGALAVAGIAKLTESSGGLDSLKSKVEDTQDRQMNNEIKRAKADHEKLSKQEENIKNSI